MKPDNNKDITEHIAKMLKEHSLPYEEGAWERFKDFEATKKRKLVLWPYFSGAAAAVIILAMSLFLIIGKDDGNNQQIAKQEIIKDIIEIPNGKSTDNNKITNSESLISTPAPSMEFVAAPRNRQIANPAIADVLVESSSSDVEEAELNRMDPSSAEESEPATSTSTQSIASNVRKPNQRESSAQEFFNGIKGIEQDADVLSTKKWDFSVELSPNIKDNDINFGGGFAIAYNLNDRISIGSGVSYMQLDAQRGPNGIDIPSEFSKLAGSRNNNKSLSTISTSLVGLDFPINLKLNIGSAMYANAGVSLFSVLNESRYNNFEERIAVTSLASPNTSPSASKSESNGVEAQTLHSQEVSVSSPYEGKNFTGFLNFSVGYKLPFIPKINLAVEPYVKIPIGSLSDQDMDLSNGGFKIKASF